MASIDKKAIVGAAIMAGGANVIMQLARPAVGYGVLESRVESGRLHRHPIKRTRTTLSYLSVAILGADADRAAYRKAVNRSHAQVRSTESSPVAYNAFDPELQLWVAACLYRGVEDAYRAFIGPITPEVQDRLYESAAPLGTTLQVRAEDWPADRAAFEEYWTEGLKQVSIDEPVRRYLLGVAELDFMPRPVQLVFGRFNRFVTTGFLPPEFREHMGLSWSVREQRWFDRFIALNRLLTRLQPGPLRRFPFNFLLWDVRWRMRTGRRLV